MELRSNAIRDPPVTRSRLSTPLLGVIWRASPYTQPELEIDLKAPQAPKEWARKFAERPQCAGYSQSKCKDLHYAFCSTRGARTTSGKQPLA